MGEVMQNFATFGLIAALISGLCAVSYSLGKRKYENESFKKKQKAFEEARRVRDTLGDPDVLRGLHDRFKR